MPRIHGETNGSSGVPIVFLHPTPADSSVWVHQIARFSASHRCVTLDLPGYGRSPGLEPGATLADVARDVWQALSAMGIGEAVLVGASAGSTVAQHMAAQEPDRAIALVLTGGGWFAPNDPRFHAAVDTNIRQFRERGPDMQVEKFREAFRPGSVDAELLAFLSGVLTGRRPWLNVDAVVHLYEALLRPMPDEVLGAIACPVLMISGGADPGHAAHRELVRRIRGARMVTIPGAGHLCQIEQPGRYDAALSAFLASEVLARGFAGRRTVSAEIASDRAPGHPTDTPLVAFIHGDDPDGQWCYVMTHLSTWFSCKSVRLADLANRVPVRTIEDLSWPAWEAIGSGPAILIGTEAQSALLVQMADRQPDRVRCVVVTARDPRVLSDREGFSPHFARSARGRYLARLLRERRQLPGPIPSALTLPAAAKATPAEPIPEHAAYPLLVARLEGAAASPHLERPAAFGHAVEQFLLRHQVLPGL